MNAHPTWFGPAEQPIFGWLHVPAGRVARAGIVCCPSIGTEATSSHRSMRLLAGELEAAGFAVLRFDYVGTGDSAGQGGEDGQVRAWQASVHEALRFLREVGTSRLGLIGLRLGATLTALAAAADGALTAVALWDPCVSGRTFLREQQALATLSLDTDGAAGRNGDSFLEPGSVELLGWVLGPCDRAEMEALSLDGLEPPAPSCLVLSRNDRPSPRALRSWDRHPAVDWAPAIGQGELIDVLPNDSKVPTVSLATITSWFDRVMPADSGPVVLHKRTQASIPMAGSATIQEAAMQLGKLRLFAMVTEPPERRSPATILLLNAGVIPHTGPARLWVTLARQLASRGLRVVRLDLSGLGDSPARAGQTPHLTHPPEAMEDLQVALRELGIQPEDAVIAGSCSGAYHAIEAGLRLPLRGVCAVNPILTYEPPRVEPEAGLGWDRQAVAPFNPLIKRLQHFSTLAAWGEFRSPPALWWLLDRIGLQAHPARSLEALARRGIPTALLCGEVEARPFLRRARWSFGALIRSGALDFDLLSQSDHNLFGAAARGRAERLILHRLTELARREESGTAHRNPAHPLLVSSHSLA